MSFTFCSGMTKAALVTHLLGRAHGRTVEHVLSGNTLWVIKQTDSAPSRIVCFLIVQEPGPVWGYQALGEGLGTPSNCPIELLGSAPIVDAAWRERVRAYHQRHSKSPVVGEIWALKRARIPHVTITCVHPRLEGRYGNRFYKLSLTQLRVPLAMAHAPKVPDEATA